jgi:predicted ATPase
VAYFQQALEALNHLPENRKTLEQSVDIRVNLGPALIAIKGFAAPEVVQTYTQARETCERLGDTSQLFPVLWGLSRVHNYCGGTQVARELGEQLLGLAKRAQDPQLLLEAHHTLWATLFSLGELTLAQDHYQRGIAIYDPQQHAHHASLYGGHDPGVCGLRHAAQMLWLLGYPDQALQRSKDALALAQKLSQPSTLSFALYASAWVHQHRGEREAVQERVERTVSLATEQGLGRWVVQGRILHGWLLAEQGKGREGILQMRQGSASTIRERPHCVALLAEACRKEGQTEEGVAMVIEELVRVHETGERYYEAELHRVRGELLLMQTVENEEQAESCFRQAVNVALGQEAKSLELRATMSLSRLWQRQGKKAEACQLLQEIYGWFTEGFDTADLKQAKALLEELS